ncbi:hypothetical protein [Nesterenkonia sp. K-15-9-6]|uniref:hypothetical protein n=1 Tax=Nesterenkonia sp. K-15-9-6 TaxID=3093918 RepID=UPI00404426C2
MDITSTRDGDGRPIIRASWVADDGVQEVHTIDLGAFASWSELLGYTDAVDVLEAILEVSVRGGEPESDPETAENVWTAPYTMLRHRERAREAEAAQAIKEGRRDDPRSPKLRGAIAARAAVMEPVGATSEARSALAQARAHSRERMRLPCPRKTSISTRPQPLTTEAEPQADTEQGEAPILTPEDRAKAREVLAPLLDEITRRKAAFLHRLTPWKDDPLGDVPPRKPARDPKDAATIFDRYRQEAG